MNVHAPEHTADIVGMDRGPSETPSEMAKRVADEVFARMDAARIAYRKRPEYAQARRDLASANLAIAMADDYPLDTTSNATSDYDWLGRRGE